jgi:hypothetical protein
MAFVQGQLHQKGRQLSLGMKERKDGDDLYDI